MLLSQQTIDYIDRVTAVAQISGIDAMVFNKMLVSGKDDTPAVVLIETDDIPEFEFNEIAVIRIPFFRQRMDAVKATGKPFTAEFDPTKGLITFAAGRTKAEYRVGNAVAVRAPKGPVKDVEAFKFPIDTELCATIARAASAYPSKDPTITFTSNGTEVEMTLVDDESNDSFSTVVSEQLECTLDGALSVRYSLKTLLPLLKQHDKKDLVIGQRGTLFLSIRGLHVHLLQRAQ